MTSNFNLTIQEEVIKKSKAYAKKHNTSVSKMVQDYLEKLTDNNSGNTEGFTEKYAGFLKGQLSNKEIEKLKLQRVKEKYGY